MRVWRLQLRSVALSNMDGVKPCCYAQKVSLITSGVNSDPAMWGARGPRGPKIMVRIFLHNSLHAPLALAVGTKKRRAQLVSLRGGGKI